MYKYVRTASRPLQYSIAYMEEADCALQYALERLGRPSLILKPEQTQAIKSVLMGKDTFVWLPTGFGKSICFEALPFAYDYKLGNRRTTEVWFW